MFRIAQIQKCFYFICIRLNDIAIVCYNATAQLLWLYTISLKPLYIYSYIKFSELPCSTGLKDDLSITPVKFWLLEICSIAYNARMRP